MRKALNCQTKRPLQDSANIFHSLDTGICANHQSFQQHLVTLRVENLHILPLEDSICLHCVVVPESRITFATLLRPPTQKLYSIDLLCARRHCLISLQMIFCAITHLGSGYRGVSLYNPQAILIAAQPLHCHKKCVWLAWNNSQARMDYSITLLECKQSYPKGWRIRAHGIRRKSSRDRDAN